jgi:hypothetical protein
MFGLNDLRLGEETTGWDRCELTWREN